MSDGVDAIYLSPHPDDAVLSCAGQIHRLAREGRAVLIVTPMAGDVSGEPPPAAARWLESCGLGEGGVAARRDEDRAACERLGAAWRHGPFVEALFRRDAAGAPLYPTVESQFAGVVPREDVLEDGLKRYLRDLPAAARVVAPLGVGGHADHRLVRRAAAAVFGGGLAYYEDYPYSNRIGAVAPHVRPRTRWSPEIIRLSPADRAARLEAIRLYASQWPAIFRTPAGLRWKNAWYLLRRLGGERLWRTCRTGSGCPRAPAA